MRVDPDKPLSRAVTLWVVVGAIVLGAPAFYLIENGSAPAIWVSEQQERLLGFQSDKVTFVLLMGIEVLVICMPLLIVAVAVKVITGKTLVELFKGK